jgi:SAM-dependent methyltransferase
MIHEATQGRGNDIVALYLQMRAKEGRLYTDETVARLPAVPHTHPLWSEWRARADSASRLMAYLTRLPQPLTILDLGCGNGWLSNRLTAAGRVLGLDRNPVELAQAARVFADNPRLRFVNADIFAAPLPAGSVDVVVIASALQYFADALELIRCLLRLVMPRGEIHILDSLLYAPAEVAEARARSQAYYAALGVPEMGAHYHHHTLASLSEFKPTMLYRPQSLAARLRRRLGLPASPFPWVRLCKRLV